MYYIKYYPILNYNVFININLWQTCLNDAVACCVPGLAIRFTFSCVKTSGFTSSCQIWKRTRVKYLLEPENRNKTDSDSSRQTVRASPAFHLMVSTLGTYWRGKINEDTITGIWVRSGEGSTMRNFRFWIVHSIQGLGKKFSTYPKTDVKFGTSGLYISVAITTAPVRVLTQRPLVPSFKSVVG